LPRAVYSGLSALRISVNQRLKVFAKDRLAAVATIHHRINRARIFEPEAARQNEFFTATPDWWQW
jgi:hypothetical protein